ncbi:MAG: hypothetical protein Q4D76_18880 [Oscillospiraceae bacterium]|nr:hypothetical protein [Oscillospiraceae bacterium]
MGNSEDTKSIEYLNGLIVDEINKCQEANKPRIYLHYSDKEHTYFEHVQYLIHDLKDAGFILHEEVKHYTNHSDVSLYFPDFLKSSLISSIIDI